MDGPSQFEELKDRYTAAVVRGDRALANSIVGQALRRGASRASIYLEVLVPSQMKLGELWLEGVINMAQQHLATTTTLGLMDELMDGMQPRAELGVRAVVTPVEGDWHFMGARIIADFLLMDGWEVDFLWNGTPAEDLREFVQQRSPDLVAISVTLPKLLPNAKAAARALQEPGSPSPKILLGGKALHTTDLDLEHLGSDAVASNALEAVSEARRLVGIAQERLTLAEHLASLGQRIKATRTSSGMSQQGLADASGLDRSYISLVEQGKQNPTIGVVLKIADALDVSIGELMAPPSWKL